MTRISDRRKRPLVLYHAVSSFQLLEVMLHRMLVHENARAVLVLPDFITEKYPQVCRLAARQWFDTVVLFPICGFRMERKRQCGRMSAGGRTAAAVCAH